MLENQLHTVDPSTIIISEERPRQRKDIGEIAKLAESNPEEILKCPVTTPVHRLDEAQAARKPDLAFDFQSKQF